MDVGFLHNGLKLTTILGSNLTLVSMKRNRFQGISWAAALIIADIIITKYLSAAICLIFHFYPNKLG